MTQQELYNFKKILENIKEHATKENLRITQHCQQEMVEEDIKLNEVLEAILSGEILENYPEHKRGPCCLVNGIANNGENIHIVCTTSLPLLVIITVYKPKHPKWITPTQRRR